MKKTTPTPLSHPVTLCQAECPYSVLLNCFNQVGSTYYQTALLAYQQHAQARITCPNLVVSTLIKDVRQLQSLFSAVYQIYCNPKDYLQTLVQHPQLMAKPKLVYLSKKEGKNPYLVFQQLFRHFSLEEVNEAFFDLILRAVDSTKKASKNTQNVSIVNCLLVVEACVVLHKRISPVGLLN